MANLRFISLNVFQLLLLCNTKLITDKMDRVGFEPRVKAYLIDYLYQIIFAIFVTIILWITGLYGDGLMSTEDIKVLTDSFTPLDDDTTWVMNIFYCITYGGIVSVFLYSLIEAFSGASLGKRHIGLIIGYEDGREGDLSLFISRWAVKNISHVMKFTMIISGMFILQTAEDILNLIMFGGCFMMLMSAKQALHDKVVMSAVYYSEIEAELL